MNGGADYGGENEGEEAVAEDADALEEGHAAAEQLGVHGDDGRAAPRDDEDGAEHEAAVVGGGERGVELVGGRALAGQEDGEGEAEDEGAPQVPVSQLRASLPRASHGMHIPRYRHTVSHAHLDVRPHYAAHFAPHHAKSVTHESNAPTTGRAHEQRQQHGKAAAAARQSSARAHMRRSRMIVSCTGSFRVVSRATPTCRARHDGRALLQAASGGMTRRGTHINNRICHGCRTPRDRGRGGRGRRAREGQAVEVSKLRECALGFKSRRNQVGKRRRKCDAAKLISVRC